MKLKDFKIIGDWSSIRSAAMATTGREQSIGEPSGIWKRRILMAEHSPIRLMSAEWTWVDLPYWVSTHFVRHHVGCDHFVQSQRVNSNRGESPQNAPVSHRMRANFQAIINISRQRLCMRAANETRIAWDDVVYELTCAEPVLSGLCVKQCVYMGFCPEIKPCGFVKTDEYYSLRRNYMSLR